jgi:hypothetical protein
VSDAAAWLPGVRRLPFVLPLAAAIYLGLRLRGRAGAPATTR